MIKFKPEENMESGVRQGSFVPTYVLLDGKRIGVVRKRSEWYGNLGHRGARYTYYDFFRLDTSGKAVHEVEILNIRDGSTREKRGPLVTGMTRKGAVAEALVRMGYVEAAREVDCRTAEFYVDQMAERA